MAQIRCCPSPGKGRSLGRSLVTFWQLSSKLRNKCYFFKFRINPDVPIPAHGSGFHGLALCWPSPAASEVKVDCVCDGDGLLDCASDWPALITPSCASTSSIGSASVTGTRSCFTASPILAAAAENKARMFAIREPRSLAACRPCHVDQIGHASLRSLQ